MGEPACGCMHSAVFIMSVPLKTRERTVLVLYLPSVPKSTLQSTGSPKSHCREEDIKACGVSMLPWSWLSV